jgi:hypothetical protein
MGSVREAKSYQQQLLDILSDEECRRLRDAADQVQLQLEPPGTVVEEAATGAKATSVPSIIPRASTG